MLVDSLNPRLVMRQSAAAPQRIHNFGVVQHARNEFPSVHDVIRQRESLGRAHQRASLIRYVSKSVEIFRLSSSARLVVVFLAPPVFRFLVDRLVFRPGWTLPVGVFDPPHANEIHLHGRWTSFQVCWPANESSRAGIPALGFRSHVGVGEAKWDVDSVHTRRAINIILAVPLTKNTSFCVQHPLQPNWRINRPPFERSRIPYKLPRSPKKIQTRATSHPSPVASIDRRKNVGSAESMPCAARSARCRACRVRIRGESGNGRLRNAGDKFR